MSLKFCFISTNMPNSKQVFSEQRKALYSSIFLPDFSLFTNISVLQLFLNPNFNLHNPVGKVFCFTRKQLFFFKCKYYLLGRILPGKFSLKCEKFRKLLTNNNNYLTVKPAIRLPCLKRLYDFNSILQFLFFFFLQNLNFLVSTNSRWPNCLDTNMS